MVTFYRVTDFSWILGKWLVDVPFYSMVNLIAEKRVVPELMQNEMTGERIAAEAECLLDNAAERWKMKKELERVSALLAGPSMAGGRDPIMKAADAVERTLTVSGVTQ